jgi:hypothetical protein
MQLDSESSEDEPEDETEADTKELGDENATQYDEDIDEDDSKLAPDEILVGIEKAAYLVRHLQQTCSNFFLCGRKKNSLIADNVRINKGEQQCSWESREGNSGGNFLQTIYL